MPRPALTEEQRRETRRRIREAAAALYAESGLADISVRTIAKKAGVSVGTIYSHFGNLTTLMQSLWRQPVRRLVQDLQTVSEEVTEPKERLRQLLEIYMAFAATEQATYRGAFMYVRPESHDQPTAVPIEEAAIPMVLIKAVRDGQASGVFREGDPIALAELVWAGVHGSLALPNNLDRVAFPDAGRIAPGMLDLLLDWLAN